MAESKKVDVAIVGAGPYGTQLAENILRKSLYEVIIFEEHSKIGEPDHCSGIISMQTFFKLSVPRSAVLNKVRTAVLFPPNLKDKITVKSKSGTVVISRPLLDLYLAERAKEAGARISLGERVLSIKARSKGYVEIFTNKSKYIAKIAILACGAGARLQHMLGFPTCKGINALQADIAGLDLDEKIYMFFSNKLYRGLFAWIIPHGDCFRVGVVGNNPVQKIKLLLKHMNQQRYKILKWHGGLIITGGPSKIFAKGLLAVIGDAACQTKPTTGGGLAFLADTSQILAEEIVRYLEGKRLSLKYYHKLWLQKFQSSFRAMRAARHFLDSLTDDEINELFRAMKKESAESLLSTADIDRQERDLIQLAVKLGKHLLKKPKIASKAFYAAAKAFFPA